MCLVLAFEIDENFRIFIRTHKNVEDLFSGPQSNGFDDGRRRNVDLQVGIVHVGTNLNELLTIVEGVSTSEKEASGDEILSRSNNGFSVTRSDQIALDVHELERFCSRFFGLGNICIRSQAFDISTVPGIKTQEGLLTQIHFVPIEIGVVSVSQSKLSVSI